MSDLSFLAPWRLLLLLVVAAVGVAYLLLQRRRKAYAVRFADVDLLASVAPKSPRWRRHVSAALLVGGMSLMVVAFAKPAAAVDVPREAATIVVAIDVSLSMEATDVSPSRVAAAQQAAVEFVENLPDTISVGLVSFAGVATVQVTPTDDHDAVVAAIGRLQLDQGTAIGDAVAASVASAVAASSAGADDGEAATPSRVVLLSDGTNTQGRTIDAAIAIATKAEVPVSTIAYGTDNGSVRVDGEQVSVPVDADSLATLATSTGGDAYTADSSTELEQVYADIGDQVGTTTQREDISSAFAGIALLVNLGAAGASLAWSPRLP